MFEVTRPSSFKFKELREINCQFCGTVCGMLVSDDNPYDKQVEHNF